MSEQAEPIFVKAADLQVLFGPTPDADRICCHLAMDLPGPIGRIHVELEPDQLAAVHDVLHRAITMSPAEVREFVQHVHNSTEEGPHE